MIPRVLSSRLGKLFEWVFSALDLGRCNFWRRSKITRIWDGTMVLKFFVNDASSSLDLTLRYFGCRGSNSMFWTQVYFPFFFLLEGGIVFTIFKSFASQGWVLDWGFGTHKQGSLVTLSTIVQQCLKGINSSGDVLATSIPSLLHSQNASSTLPSFGPSPSKINHSS